MVEEMTGRPRPSRVTHEHPRKWGLKVGRGIRQPIRRRGRITGRKWHRMRVVIRQSPGGGRSIGSGVPSTCQRLVLEFLIQSRPTDRPQSALFSKLRIAGRVEPLVCSFTDKLRRLRRGKAGRSCPAARASAA